MTTPGTENPQPVPSPPSSNTTTTTTPFDPNLPPPPSPPILYAIAPVNNQSPEYAMRMRQEEKGWSHNRPNSVLLWAIGNHWKPGSWQHVMDMMKFTIDQGVYVEFREGQDRCFEYADALGVMRNEGILVAENLGLEWICFVENDVWPPPDALIRMLQDYDATKANIITPFICEQGSGRPLHGPHVGPDSGFHWMKWSVLSFIMFRTAIFKSYPGDFWETAIGADEGYHFQKFFRNGYYLGMDSALQIPALRRPQYPLASNHMADAERKAHWEYINKARLQPPDRRPINPSCQLIDEHGSYNPFIPKSCNCGGHPARQEEDNAANSNTDIK